jgi:hypothetical protein
MPPHRLASSEALMADVHPASKDQTHGNRRVGDSTRVTEWSLAERFLIEARKPG